MTTLQQKLTSHGGEKVPSHGELRFPITTTDSRTAYFLIIFFLCSQNLKLFWISEFLTKNSAIMVEMVEMKFKMQIL